MRVVFQTTHELHCIQYIYITPSNSLPPHKYLTCIIANRPNVTSLKNLYFSYTGPLINHKTSICLFTTETELDIYLLNLGKRLIGQSSY
jgi:hypothetical protein